MTFFINSLIEKYYELLNNLLLWSYPGAASSQKIFFKLIGLGFALSVSLTDSVKLLTGYANYQQLN